MSEDMKQPKFKFGAKVRDGRSKREFVVSHIFFSKGDSLFHYDTGTEVFIEPFLEEVKEPLRIEFECEWSDGDSTTQLIHPVGMGVAHACSPFIGKRTKVILEELP